MTTERKELPAWVNAVAKAKDRFIKQAKVHGDIEWDSESAFIRQAFQSSPELQNCTPQTITNVIEQIGAIGISTSPQDKLAFIQAQNVKVSKKPDVWEAQAVLKIQFTGLIKLLVDSGACEYIRADVVHESDNFVYHGPTAKPEFTVANPFGDDRGPVVGAFAEALTADGTTYCEILRIEELDAIKNASKSKDSGPWKTFENEMRKKAAIRRLYKTIPKRNQRVTMAVAATQEDEEFDFNDTPTAPPQPTYSNDEKKQFWNGLKSGDGAMIWHLERSMDQSAWIDLTRDYVNSAPRGEKGVFRQKLKALGDAGYKIFTTGAEQLLTAMENEDYASADEILADFDGQRSTLDEQMSTEVSFWLAENPA